MRLIFTFIIVLIISFSTNGREKGQTEITTEEGIEVFQSEKYYLLKKNVKIVSDDFVLNGDLIKIFFENDLYDIKKIDAYDNVELNSNKFNINANGERLTFTLVNEEIYIKGLNSKLSTSDANMFSDGEIKVNNSNGSFVIKGPNSWVENQNIYIKGDYIDGIFLSNKDIKEIAELNVEDDNISYIKDNDTEMYANIIRYDKEKSIIELEKNVKIIRNGETITGDYGTLDTKNSSYKVRSNDTNKVKVIITSKNE